LTAAAPHQMLFFFYFFFRLFSSTLLPKTVSKLKNPKYQPYIPRSTKEQIERRKTLPLNRFEKMCDAAVVVVRIRENRCRRLRSLRLGHGVVVAALSFVAWFRACVRETVVSVMFYLCYAFVLRLQVLENWCRKILVPLFWLFCRLYL